MRILGFLAIAFALSAPGVGIAAAQNSTAEPDNLSKDNYGFGSAGVLAFSSDAAVTIQHSSQDVTTIQLAPAADYFIIDGLSLGGFISFDYSKSGAGDGSRFGIGPRIGYNLKLSDNLSLWPKAGFAYAHSSSTVSTDVGNGATVARNRSGDAIAMNLFVPLMIHPAAHFFAGFGPFLDVDLSGDDRVTVFGAKLTLGGWIN